MAEYFCPNCGAALDEQGLADTIQLIGGGTPDWVCMCGAYLRNTYGWYEVFEEEKEDKKDNHAASPRDSQEENSKEKEKRILEGKLKRQRRRAFFFKHKKIKIGFSHTDLQGENVGDVESRLYNQAFNNIKTIPIKDIYKGSSHSVGEVKQVVIAGSTRFKSGDMVPYDTEIVIKYHAKKEITVPFAENSLKKMNYVAVGDKFRELGFTEIHECPIRDIVVGWLKKDGEVEKVTIEKAHSFKENSVFKYDAKIVIEYHTFILS